MTLYQLIFHFMPRCKWGFSGMNVIRHLLCSAWKSVYKELSRELKTLSYKMFMWWFDSRSRRHEERFSGGLNKAEKWVAFQNTAHSLRWKFNLTCGFSEFMRGNLQYLWLLKMWVQESKEATFGSFRRNRRKKVSKKSVSCFNDIEFLRVWAIL